MKPRRLFRVGMALGASILLYLGGLAAIGCVDNRATADVAVVLGSQVFPDGTLSPRLKARMDTALDLYASKRVRALLVSGATGAEGVNEAEAMAAYARLHGVPESGLWIDPAGATTRATARNAAKMLRAHGASTAVLVSSYYHLARCRLAFRQTGISVAGASPACKIWEGRELYALPREGVAFLVYVFGQG